ncbi:MAG: hypothetical protein KA319_01865 [Ferruginibacter sp.]|nr:hypothetical protein [Ferruginibacter sp.]
MNKVLYKELNNLPSDILIVKYIDRKKKNNNFNVSLLVNNRNVKKKQHKKKISFKNEEINDNDSLAFLIKSKGVSLLSQNFSFRRFKNGGDLIIGIITNYDYEITKLLNNYSNYIIENSQNHLAKILLRTKDNDTIYRGKSYKIIYCLTKSNLTSLVSLNYLFFK